MTVENELFISDVNCVNERKMENTNKQHSLFTFEMSTILMKLQILKQAKSNNNKNFTSFESPVAIAKVWLISLV